MSTAHANTHLAVVGQVAETRATEEMSPGSTNSRVGLARLDRLALGGLLSGDDAEAVVTWAADAATALVNDRDAARLRLVSRAVATERARQVVLEALLDERLADRDLDAVKAINGVLSSTTRRLCALLQEHERACASGHRASIVISQAVVHVSAEK